MLLCAKGGGGRGLSGIPPHPGCTPGRCPPAPEGNRGEQRPPDPPPLHPPADHPRAEGPQQQPTIPLPRDTPDPGWGVPSAYAPPGDSSEEAWGVWEPTHCHYQAGPPIPITPPVSPPLPSAADMYAAAFPDGVGGVRATFETAGRETGASFLRLLNLELESRFCQEIG